MKRMLMVAFMLTSCASGSKDVRSNSKHFDGRQFNNEQENVKSFWSFLRMRISTTYAKWPIWVESDYGKISAERVEGSMVHITLINHSTVLIQTEGLNILTDPVYSKRVSPLTWAGPKRVRNPGVRFEDLPKIDVVLISHDHYDHLDVATIQRLAATHNPRFYVGLGVKKHLGLQAQVFEMDWWSSSEYSMKLKIHFAQVQHFSGRGLFDRNSTLWGGFILETPQRKIYFGGDAGYSSAYTQTFEKFGPMDISLLPIGAYEPHDFMKYAHMNPAEAVQAHIDLQSNLSIGIHYGTFQLTAEPIDAPQQQLQEALRERQLRNNAFIAPAFGITTKLDARSAKP